MVSADAASALTTEPPGFAGLLAVTLAWLDGAGGESRDVIVLGDPRYPQALLQAADPPLLLYAKGRTELLNAANSIAIVGSRNATAQGLENARAFAAYLSHAGFVIVSGMALGIDGAVSIELEYSPQPDKIVDWVREAYEATDRLLTQVGLRE